MYVAVVRGLDGVVVGKTVVEADKPLPSLVVVKPKAKTPQPEPQQKPTPPPKTRQKPRPVSRAVLMRRAAQRRAPLQRRKSPTTWTRATAKEPSKTLEKATALIKSPPQTTPTTIRMSSIAVKAPAPSKTTEPAPAPKTAPAPPPPKTSTTTQIQVRAPGLPSKTPGKTAQPKSTPGTRLPTRAAPAPVTTSAPPQTMTSHSTARPAGWSPVLVLGALAVGGFLFWSARAQR